MPRLGPISRSDLVRYLRRLGFQGPYAGKKHEFMVKGDVTVRLPNPHRGDVGRELLVRVLSQGRISIREWRRL